jgi:hypothetical protein
MLTEEKKALVGKETRVPLFRSVYGENKEPYNKFAQIREA